MPCISLRVAFLVAAATAWGIAVGCSSFSGDSSPGAPAPAEAGIETSAPVEAGEAADVGSPPAPRFCKTGDASTAAFCADFDDGPVGDGWQGVFKYGGSTIGTTPSDRSAPNAFLSSVDSYDLIAPTDAAAGDAEPYGAAVLATTLGRGFASGATLDFDVRIEELPPAVTIADGGAASALLATLGFDADVQSVNLTYYQGSLVFVVYDPGLKEGRIIETVPLPSGLPRWIHVRMNAHFNGVAAELLLDGITVAKVPRGMDSKLLGIVLNLGVSASAPSGKARAAYDNVVVTLF